MWNLIVGDVAVAVLFVAVTGEIGVNGESKVTGAIVAVLVVAAAGESILAPVATPLCLLLVNLLVPAINPGSNPLAKCPLTAKKAQWVLINCL